MRYSSLFSAWDQIPLFSYDFIMADPPWKFKSWSEGKSKASVENQYSTMEIDDICRLRVGELAQPNCMLWLWATNPMLDQALRAMDAWGFTFKTAGHWVKLGSKSGVKFGTGHVLRSSGEPFLIGTIGRPHNARTVSSIIQGLARQHSRKPDIAYKAAEKLTPRATRRIELFSRESRAGWDCFGDEVGFFDFNDGQSYYKPKNIDLAPVFDDVLGVDFAC